MKNTLILTGCIFFIVLISGYLFFFKIKDAPMQKIVSENQSLLEKQPHQSLRETPPSDKSPAQPLKKLKKSKRFQSGKKRPTEDIAPVKADPPSKKDDHIDAIKQAIYSLNIEYAEQIERIDELVETGNTDTRELWDSDWTSADDWKKDSNGFSLEKHKDGTLIFSPDAQTARKYTFFENPRAYTYDEENNEFVNEVDYYGKPIYNVAKFINNDVLVMMTISGRKVDLNIYRKFAQNE